MSLAIVYTRANQGVEAPLITVETHLSNGLPALNMVGLPETAVKESRERVRSAILNAGLEFPARRITINMAPADIPKSGGRYDLAIALSILAASGQLPAVRLATTEILGELALAGEVRSVQGVLPAVIAARDAGRSLMVPAANAEEASIVSGSSCVVVATLRAAFRHFSEQPLTPLPLRSLPARHKTAATEISAVKGQALAKHALLIAAAGGHNMLMVGPPGTGKTLLANALPGLLPSLDEREALSVAAVRSVAGLKIDAEDWACPPFRAPHHGASSVAIVGGGRLFNPGEVTLAHGGILFLDELTEFKRHVLESLREPLEAGMITISRADYRVSYPARFQLVAAANPCPCGYAGDDRGYCRCTPERIARYVEKISGPLLDRIDVHVEVPRLGSEELRRPAPLHEPDSAALRERVLACRNRQIKRQSCLNRELNAEVLDEFCPMQPQAESLIRQSMEKLNLSARACHRMIKLARTLADLDEQDVISASHVAQAASFRQFAVRSFKV
ncbi:MAG: YifB family Mg chelatase-like AAA ATPase [Pseudohongiella sp.]|nr:YifB family Mg chelatase-like AAA ATPase [Pseudohongiella sp.]